MHKSTSKKCTCHLCPLLTVLSWILRTGIFVVDSKMKIPALPDFTFHFSSEKDWMKTVSKKMDKAQVFCTILLCSILH